MSFGWAGGLEKINFCIESTTVLSSYQDRGIGKMLKRILIEEVKKCSYKRITNHVANEVIRGINKYFGLRGVKYFKR